MAMREGWERRQRYVDLDMATLTEMVQPVFPGQRVVSAERLGGGLINTNYKLVIAGQDEAVVLRVYTREPTRDICAKEAAILRLIHERVPVPDLLFADAEGVAFGRPYILMGWVEGVMLKEVLASGSAEEIGQAGLTVGETLAAIGSYTFPRAGFFGHGLDITEPMGSIEQYIGSCLEGRAGERLGEATSTRLRQMLAEGAQYLKQGGEQSSLAHLVHSDFQDSNILLRREASTGGSSVWKTAAIVDWEWAHAGDPLLDIAILLRYDLRLPSAFEPNFIASFAQHGGKLPAEWKKISKLYDLINLCEFLNSPDKRGTMVEDVKALVLETIARWYANELG